MRSFTPKTLALASALVIVPFAGAFAASSTAASSLPDGQYGYTVVAKFQGPRVDAIVGQLQSIDNGVNDALNAKEISPAQAHRMEARAGQIEKTAEKTASADHGKIPMAQYDQLLHRVDRLDQRLDTYNGTALQFTNGNDG
jgi:hypothetical protein